MFEVGALVARIKLEGAQQFGSDLDRVGKSFTKLDENGRQAMSTVGQGLALVGTAILGVVATAVAKFAEFDKAMSEVNAVTQTTAENQAKLRQAALDAGAATVYSATEAAQAEVSLAKAGVQTADIIGGGLTGALSLAAAGQVDVADAADTAATAMTQFGLSGSKIPHVADLLAAGAGKAQGGVDDLSLALKQSGLVASQFGLSVDDTVGALAAFASAGLIGSDAGTSFKQALLSLANPSTQASEALKQYNIHAYDARGNFVGLANLAGQLKTNLAGATQAERDQALATIFGTDAIRVANVLYKEGADGIQAWTDKVNDSGYAVRQAAALQDNLSGDVEKLGGAFDTAFIQTGAAANDIMRDMVQGLTRLVDAYGDLPQPVQAAALYLGTGAGALTLFAGAALLAIPKIVEFRQAIITLRTEVPQLGSALGKVGAFLTGPWGIGLTAGIAILTRWADVQVKAGTQTDALTDSLEAQTGAVTDNTKALIAKQLQDQGVYDAAKKAGISIKEVNDAVFKGGAYLDSYNQKTAAYYSSVGLGGNIMRSFSGEAAALADGVNVARQDIESAKDAHDNLAESQQAGAGAAQANADANKTASQSYVDESQKVSDLQDALDQLIDTINKANGVGQDAVSTNASYQQALVDVAAKVKDLQGSQDAAAHTIDQSTAAGAANAQMFSDLAAKSQDAALAQYKLDGNTANYRATLEAGRQKLIDNIVALTGNRDAAVAFADSVYRIPTQKEFDLIANTKQAQDQVNGFIRANDGRRLSVYVDAVGGQTYQAVNGAGQAISPKFRANGAVDWPTYHAFAGGGTIRENHTAQIAAAGSWRVWAEPETGGELYAPLAPSKRTQSMSLIGQVLDDWGYDIVRKGGSTPAPSSAATAGPSTFTGTLVLDSGEFLGTVHGVVGQALDDERRTFDNGSRPGA